MSRTAAQSQTQTTALSAHDLLATLVGMNALGVARTVQQALPLPDLINAAIYVSGGGHRNAVLMAALRRHLPSVRFASVDALGIPIDAKEAVLFAVLANETVAGAPPH